MKIYKLGKYIILDSILSTESAKLDNPCNHQVGILVMFNINSLTNKLKTYEF